MQEPEFSPRMLIGGQWCEARDGARFPSVNPYSGQSWATVPDASEADADRAVEAARAAFDHGGWPQTLASGRARLLRRLATLIEENALRLAQAQVSENGKLLREMLGQTAGLAGFCHYFAGLAETSHGHTVPAPVNNMFTYTVREPVGVVLAITPWNSPLSLLMWKLGPALAAGNTMVIKPSEVTPVSTLLLAELIEEAGFPPGVVNVVTGAGSLGSHLVSHPGIDRIAFTGSTDVGKKIMRASADHLTPVSLELGGKSPNIVFADATLESAVSGAVAGIFGAAGQTCLAGSRVLVQDTIYDEFAELFVDRTKRIVLGDPMNEQTEMGPLACRPQYDKVLSFFDIAKEEGLTVLTGCTTPTDPGLTGGFFVEPTIFGDVPPNSRVAVEEIFGPVVCLIRFHDEDEAVAIANDSRFGLAAGVWSNDVRRVHRMTSRLRAGTVWVNTYRRTSYALPFGGYRESGIGRENGLDALNEFTETKSIWLNLTEGVTDPFNPRA